MKSILIKTVPGYKFYSDGRIWSEHKKDFMVGDNCSDGYNRVKVNGVRKHRSYWIALAFIPNPDNLPEVNHIDENKMNDSVRNLEWCDKKYNCNYGTRNKRIKEKQLNRKDHSKVVEQLTFDGELVATYPSTQEAQRQTGFCRVSISYCCLGKSKQAYGYIWRFKEPQAS